MLVRDSWEASDRKRRIRARCGEITEFGGLMKQSVEGDDRKQVALLPECADGYIGQDEPVGVIDCTQLLQRAGTSTASQASGL